MKTIDKKNVYKVADAPQIMICSHDLQPVTAETSPPNDIFKSKRDKMWQWPHGREHFCSILSHRVVALIFLLLFQFLSQVLMRFCLHEGEILIMDPSYPSFYLCLFSSNAGHVY